MSNIDGILGVDVRHVPVMSLDRSIPRKEQAKIARYLFKQIGLKGISVTCPNYSMAHSVDVVITGDPIFPGDYIQGSKSYELTALSDMPVSLPAQQKRTRGYKARLKVEEILLKAFPNHGDRSEYGIDYYDSKWSVDCSHPHPEKK